MKNIIIAGVPRSGKTIVSRRIAKTKNISHVPIDALLSTIETVYPSLEVTHETVRPGDLNKKMDELFFSYLDELECEKTNFVIDTCHTMPERFINRGLEDKYSLIFIGYKDIDPKDKIDIIRTTATKDDWTNDLDDSHLLDLVKEFIDVSNIMYEQCKKYNINYIDSSKSFSVIDDAYELLINKEK